jgi:ATP-binding cassette subfamily B protein
MSFPLGYDAQVGEIGSHLSLGQRQRIAIARALIKDAPIILLDEPTASLDSESEHKVKDALRQLSAGKTTIVIAHRLNTIEDADCIHVVDKGAIVESGSHRELLRKGGRYASFFRLQFRDQTAGAARPVEPAVS